MVWVIQRLSSLRSHPPVGVAQLWIVSRHQAMSALPPLPGQFSAEVVRSDGDRTMVYVNGRIRRLEMSDPKTGVICIIIGRPDKGVLWSLTPHTKTYSQTKLPKRGPGFDPFDIYDWKEDGSAVIDGRKCRRFIGRLRDASVSEDAHEACFVDANTGMRRRMVGYVKGKATLTIDYLSAVVGPPPSKLFEMPKGHKRVYHREH
jgi:hypothetical protein